MISLQFLNKLHMDKLSAGMTVEANNLKQISSNPYPELGNYCTSIQKQELQLTGLPSSWYVPPTYETKQSKVSVFTPQLLATSQNLYSLCSHNGTETKQCILHTPLVKVAVTFSSSDHLIKLPQARSWSLECYKTVQGPIFLLQEAATTPLPYIHRK